MSTLTIGTGFAAFVAEFEQDFVNPFTFLADDPTDGIPFSTFTESLDDHAKLAFNSGTEIALSGDGYYLIIDGTSLKPHAGSEGLAAATFLDYFANSSGNISGFQVYEGGSLTNGVHSGGTLVGSATLSGSEYTLTVGESQVEVDGANLPTSFASIQALAGLSYAGSGITISDIKMSYDGSPEGEITLPSDPLTTAISDYEAFGALLSLSGSSFDPLQLSTTQLVFQSEKGFLVIDGSDLGYSGSLTAPIDLADLSGTITSSTVYSGGSYNSTSHEVTGGKDVGELTFSSSEIEASAGKFKIELLGTHLPTSAATWMEITQGDYTGPAIDISAVKLIKDGKDGGAITLSSSHLTATFLGYKMQFTGTFTTAFTASMIDGKSAPTFDATSVKVTQVSTGDTVMSLTGFSSPINLLQSDSLSEIFGSITAITAAETTAGVTFELTNSGETIDGIPILSGAPVTTLTGGSGNDTFLMGGFMTASDRINGEGGSNTVVLDGNYSSPVTFKTTTMVDIQKLELTAGFDYNLKIAATTVASGQTLTVQGGSLGTGDTLTFNGTAAVGTLVLEGGAGTNKLTGGSGHTTFYSGGGVSDTFTAGTGTNTFVFASHGQSSLATHVATIGNFNFETGNQFDLWLAVSAIDATVTASKLTTAALQTAFGTHLGIDHSALVDVGSNVYLVVDTDGKVGYNSDDLMFHLTGSANLSHLSTADFGVVGIG